jgi:hypothetical protein
MRQLQHYSLLLSIHRLCDVLMWKLWNIPCLWIFTGYVKFSCGDLHENITKPVNTKKQGIFQGFHMRTSQNLWILKNREYFKVSTNLEIFPVFLYSQVLWCSHVETLKYSLFFCIHRFCNVLMWKPWNIPCFLVFTGFVMFSCGCFTPYWHQCSINGKQNWKYKIIRWTIICKWRENCSHVLHINVGSGSTDFFYIYLQ